MGSQTTRISYAISLPHPNIRRCRLNIYRLLSSSPVLVQSYNDQHAFRHVQYSAISDSTDLHATGPKLQSICSSSSLLLHSDHFDTDLHASNSIVPAATSECIYQSVTTSTSASIPSLPECSKLSGTSAVYLASAATQTTNTSGDVIAAAPCPSIAICMYLPATRCAD